VVNIGNTINSILPALENAAEKKGLKIEFDIDKEPLTWVTDSRSLLQIIVELVINAVSYSETGTIRIEVTCGDRLYINIKDQGIGFDESNYSEIFIPFHQLENPYTRIRGGLGIGLSIVKQLCTKIDAEISLNSVPGYGTEFRVTLPPKFLPEN
jgi:signal transduction histidine kinase